MTHTFETLSADVEKLGGGLEVEDGLGWISQRDLARLGVDVLAGLRGSGWIFEFGRAGVDLERLEVYLEKQGYLKSLMRLIT